jgi:tRNA (guanine-N7-)-methyltransferase
MRRTKRLPLEELAPYLWQESPSAPGVIPPLLDWRLVFGNDHPVELEVGFGKGLFLLNAAIRSPDVNFFGIEIMRKYQLFTATRMAVRKLTNVRLACADARQFLQHRIVAESLQAIHVYFPDPWWKKRHHKRRVFTAEFVESCTRALKVGGHFHLATDVPDYFAVMQDLCANQAGLLVVPGAPVAAGQEYLTNFERKAILVGQPVQRTCYRKIAHPPH